MKKIFALLVFGFGVAATSFAQESKFTATNKMFSDKKQYRTFSLGINGGALAPVVVLGGSNDYTNWDADFGYGIYLKKQLAHMFGLQANLMFGKLSGNNSDAPSGIVGNYKSFETKIAYGADLRGVLNLGTINFLKRNNAVNFTATAGYGLLAYAPSYVNAANTEINWKGQAKGGNDYIKEAFIPLGLGVKFKVSEGVSFDVGYTMNFVDGDNLDANYAKPNAKDNFSYSSVGLEFALGSKTKSNLVWSNPVALMYDDLSDSSLKADVLQLKDRAKKSEDNIINLRKDGDGDGVADQFDKCPATQAGVIVDGSGCPLIVPAG